MNVDGGPLRFLLGMGSIRPCLVLLFYLRLNFILLGTSIYLVFCGSRTLQLSVSRRLRMFVTLDLPSCCFCFDSTLCHKHC